MDELRSQLTSTLAITLGFWKFDAPNLSCDVSLEVRMEKHGELLEGWVAVVGDELLEPVGVLDQFQFLATTKSNWKLLVVRVLQELDHVVARLIIALSSYRFSQFEN